MYNRAASGYGSLSVSPLARPGYHNEILVRVYERDFLAEITNQLIDSRSLRCNQEIQIMREPDVGPWRPYEDNQEMVPNQVSASADCLRICHAAYCDIKVEEKDIYFSCDLWNAWEDAFLNQVYQRYVEKMRTFVFSRMLVETSPRNKGPRAGKYRNINLGTVGAPVIVTPDNIQQKVADLRQVLVGNERWIPGEMFLIVPTDFQSLLVSSNYANAAWTGACKPCSMAIDGDLGINLVGFRVIETNHALVVPNDTGSNSPGFWVIAGHKKAYMYASDIIQGRLVRPHRTWSVEYQMLAVWGGKMIYPDSMAIAYWSFQYTT